MRIIIKEAWSDKRKKEVNCDNPRGFSEKAHCAGRKARQAGRETKSKPVEEESIVVPEDLQEAPPLVVVEKNKLDRCARIAKRKYKVWPSAYACVPEETSKALTRDGWKTVDELSIDEEILTFNLEKDILEFKPIQKIHRYKNVTTNIIRSGNTGFVFESTPNHKWVIKLPDIASERKNKYTRNQNGYSLLETSEILNNRNHKLLVVSGLYRDGGGKLKSKIYKYGDNWINYLLESSQEQRQAWLFSAIVYDGNQKKTERVIENSSLSALEWEYDGNHGKQSFGFKQKDIMHRDAFLLSAFLNEGMVTWKKVKDREIYSCNYTSNKRFKNASNFRIMSEKITDVWCPQTENSTWVMMQETNGQGIITITGNSGAAVKCRQGKIWKGLKEGKVSSVLSSIAKGDQELRNEFAALMKNRGGWSKQLVDEFVAEKGTDKEDVFGDKKRQKEFANLFSSLTDDDYNDFSEEDWRNFWLVAQHADSNRQLQKKAQQILLKHKGEESDHYRYITDRISCAETGSQKYGTQDICGEPIEERKKKRKYKPSFTREKEEGLHGWFARNRGKGWVNCRTGGPCGRESADGGGKYPACRPTLAQCKSAGRGPLRKKKSSKPISWTNEGIEMKLENLILEEFRNVKLELMSEGMRYHIETKTSLYNPIYRPGSKAFATLMREARELYEMGQEFSLEEKEMLEGDCGKYGIYEGKKVPLEYPMVEEELDEAEYKGKDVPIGKPQRGGSKKFYVYVKDGDRVKKISFGDPNLSVKVGDPKRRASFVARHRCTEKNDRLTAGYWSCRIGRFPHLTGAKQRYTWW